MIKVLNLVSVKPSVSIKKYLRLFKREKTRLYNSKITCFEYKIK